MKRTLLPLALLTSIILLSCSTDNSTPLTEDLNYPQSQTLNKAVPENTIAATGSQKVISGKTMSVAAVPVGSFACSNEIDYYFGNPPATATINKLEASGGALASNAGAFTMSYLRVRCGTSMTYATMPWGGSTTINPSTTYTTGLNGQAAKTTCYLSFCGTCVGGYYVGTTYVPMCNKSYSNVGLTVHYGY